MAKRNTYTPEYKAKNRNRNTGGRADDQRDSKS